MAAVSSGGRLRGQHAQMSGSAAAETMAAKRRRDDRHDGRLRAVPGACRVRHRRAHVRGAISDLASGIRPRTFDACVLLHSVDTQLGAAVTL